MVLTMGFFLGLTGVPPLPAWAAPLATVSVSAMARAETMLVRVVIIVSEVRLRGADRPIMPATLTAARPQRCDGGNRMIDCGALGSPAAQTIGASQTKQGDNSSHAHQCCRRGRGIQPCQAASRCLLPGPDVSFHRTGPIDINLHRADPSVLIIDGKGHRSSGPVSCQKSVRQPKGRPHQAHEQLPRDRWL